VRTHLDIDSRVFVVPQLALLHIPPVESRSELVVPVRHGLL
jgi:hypothetical protein